jgi:cytochrome c556
MVRTHTSRLFVAAALAAVLAACSGGEPAEAPADAPTKAPAGDAAAPADDVKAVLKQRHDLFEGIGDAFKAIRGQLEKDAPDFALIGTKATEINTAAGKIAGLFPPGTSVDDGYKTEALATIWEKPEEFKAATQKLLDESAKLATVAGEGKKDAVGAQVMALGGACKGCHEKFRLDDKK